MTAAFDLNRWMALQLDAVERALDCWVNVDASADLDHHAPAELMAAMRYAVLDGGKRLRPLLVLAAYEAVSAGQGDGRGAQAALRAACAVELIHAYSLVHDDMPCMDNDVLRRGKPTVHVQFGQASALLAGDALQALAFELLTPEPAVMPDAQQARLCRLLSRAAGCTGMAGGQAIDLASVGLQLTESQLRQMHRLKTGALLQASVMMGATCSQTTALATAALQEFGAAIGLAFQVVDDILDVTADSATLGKTAGKDADCDKPTYVSLMGLDQATAYANELLAQALAALARSGLADVDALQALAVMVVQRSH
ncbi:polyprenyl synthetase family protein [Rhodoferax sp.]|uniref:polyprenyl synthetase family protein n=1 Tax=Rhodoferax sp. TaxID=50421 RepID=UPI0026224FC4|nr:farnesyl diphosphate synthase [Rhodoferax sp.]MDD2925057.1 polyprenyl synthetase family protein [Rhodoferax sp.]